MMNTAEQKRAELLQARRNKRIRANIKETEFADYLASAVRSIQRAYDAADFDTMLQITYALKQYGMSTDMMDTIIKLDRLSEQNTIVSFRAAKRK